jgi:hypothetical protein
MIFKVTDLVQNRTEFLEAARVGRALVRDTDGTGLVMLRETELESLEWIADWSSALSRLQRVVRMGERPSVGDLGSQLAWLRVFDLDDIEEFANELDDVLVATRSDNDAGVLQECIRAWKVTARQLEDPLRRRVLLGPAEPHQLVSAERPGEESSEPTASDKAALNVGHA